MFDKLEWSKTHADRLRRIVMLEPRGHADLTGMVLTEPVTPGAHAGMLFMRGSGFVPLSLDGVIAGATIALDKGVIVVEPGSGVLSFDTAAGTVRVGPTLQVSGDSRHSVVCTGVPSFVEHGGLRVPVGTRTIHADVAYSGGFYAIVDAEVAGLPLGSSHRPELRRAGMAIAAAVSASRQFAHPLEPRLAGIDGVIFTSPPGEHGAHVTTVTVFADGQISRSPSASSTAALVVILDAMGWLASDAPLVHEGPLGTRVTGKVGGRTQVGERPAIIPEVTASAWITGEYIFVGDEADPLLDGYQF
jgi:proline racemase